MPRLTKLPILSLGLACLATALSGCHGESSGPESASLHDAWELGPTGLGQGRPVEGRQGPGNQRPGKQGPGKQVPGEPMQYPDPNRWEAATASQSARAARSFERMRSRGVPAYNGPLMVDDDGAVELQDASDVARRVLVLWAVELRAEGIPKAEAHELIENLSLWEFVSSEEKRFLAQDHPDPDESRQLVWRLESLWVLMWALGYIDELQWPDQMCDVAALVEIIKPNERNPEFISGAKLRSKQEILDAQDLTMRIHWAVRDAFLSERSMLPANLDWTGDDDWILTHQSPAVGVVEERHYVLNWLVKFLDPDNWDTVDTPT